MCPGCGGLLDDHRQAVRFTLPDALRNLPPEWVGITSTADLFCEVVGVAGFVRVLMDIRLTDGASLNIGTWLRVHPNALHHVQHTWEAPSYAELVIDGELANGMGPWGSDILGASARAAVTDPSELPHITSSEDALLHRVLTEEWPHAQVFRALGLEP